MKDERRAYGLLEIKSLDEAQRTIEGIASTPTPDHMDDVVMPLGAEFELPLPFLWQHEGKEAAIGAVVWARPNKDGIPVRIQLETDDVAGPLKDRLDYAWRSIRKGLVRGLSIGFRGLDVDEREGSWGLVFKRWRWLELSAVTIPANMEANIQTVKSLDAGLRTATRKTGARPLSAPPLIFRGCADPPLGARSLSSPGVSGTSLKS